MCPKYHRPFHANLHTWNLKSYSGSHILPLLQLHYAYTSRHVSYKRMLVMVPRKIDILVHPSQCFKAWNF